MDRDDRATGMMRMMGIGNLGMEMGMMIGMGIGKGNSNRNKLETIFLYYLSP